MKRFIEQIYKNTKDYRGIIFLDRDGTINEEVNYLSGKMQLKLLPRVVEGIGLLNKHNIAVVITTNQPVVARGIISIEDLKEINNELVRLLNHENAFIDAIYSCPHHPEQNHTDIPESALKYRIICDCRKPGLAMYQDALKVYGTRKILGVVGDQTKDILAGQNLGTIGVLVKTGYGGKDEHHKVVPDYISDNFLEAITYCIDKLF